MLKRRNNAKQLVSHYQMEIDKIDKIFPDKKIASPQAARNDEHLTNSYRLSPISSLSQKCSRSRPA